MTLSLEELRRMADRVAASHGLDVVEIEFLGGSKHRMLRIFIEKNLEGRLAKAEEFRSAQSQGTGARERDGLPRRIAVGGEEVLDQLAWVTHEDCERFSRDFGTVLDVEDVIPGGEYTLEVSSPGLDRKLSSPKDFERFIGSMAKVQTFEPQAGNRHWQGRIEGVNETGIILDLKTAARRKTKKGAEAMPAIKLNFSNIEKANLIPEM
jgi:ribosome maturation factor RimP